MQQHKAISENTFPVLCCLCTFSKGNMKHILPGALINCPKSPHRYSFSTDQMKINCSMKFCCHQTLVLSFVNFSFVFAYVSIFWFVTGFYLMCVYHLCFFKCYLYIKHSYELWLYKLMKASWIYLYSWV